LCPYRCIGPLALMPSQFLRISNRDWTAVTNGFAPKLTITGTSLTRSYQTCFCHSRLRYFASC
jgi:hypothetical protein